MVGIPMDRVGMEYAGMWLLLYREWDCLLVVLRFVSGVGYTVYAKPKRSSELLTPQRVLVCAVPAAIFFSGCFSENC